MKKLLLASAVFGLALGGVLGYFIYENSKVSKWELLRPEINSAMEDTVNSMMPGMPSEIKDPLVTCLTDETIKLLVERQCEDINSCMTDADMMLIFLACMSEAMSLPPQDTPKPQGPSIGPLDPPSIDPEEAQ